METGHLLSSNIDPLLSISKKQAWFVGARKWLLHKAPAHAAHGGQAREPAQGINIMMTRRNYKILSDNQTHCMQLPSKFEIYNVLHVSCFWQWATNRKVQPPPPLVFEDDASYEVECVLSHKYRGSCCHPNKLHLIKWLRYTLEHNYWELESKLNAKGLEEYQGNTGMWEPSRTTYLHYMVLSITLEPHVCINVWVKRFFMVGAFLFVQACTRSYQQGIIINLSQSTSGVEHEYGYNPLGLVVSWVVVLSIVSMHYGLGFAIYKHIYSFLSEV
jgi:hypothetical protein